MIKDKFERYGIIMIKIPKNRFETVFSIMLSLSVLSVGILLVISCLEIYNSGDSPYTREIVIHHLQRLISPIIVFVVLIVVGLILGVFANEPLTIKGTKDNSTILKNFYRKFDISMLDEQTHVIIKKEYRKRRILSCVEAAVCGLSVALSGSYMFFFATYTIEKHNENIITALAFVLPIVAFAFITVTVFEAVKNHSCSVEIAAVKSGIAKAKLHAREVCADNERNASKAAVTVARYALLALATAFIVLGIINGGMADVLGKAVRICTECIGLG